MPTYQYRCLHCQHIQATFQGVQEAYAPPCTECGGLTERFIGQAPTVLGKTSPPPEAEQPESSPTQDTHECSSACVLHRKFEQPIEAD